MFPVLLLGTAACGGGDDAAAPSDEETATTGAGDAAGEIPGVEVTGEVGEEPEVEVDSPLELEETTSAVVSAGEGDDAVAMGEQALLHLYVANGSTGEKALTSYDQGEPVALTMSNEQLFPVLVEALVGQPVGSRVAVAAVPDDGYGPNGAEQLGIGGEDSVVFVADVISSQPSDVLQEPSGEETDDPADLPAIEESEGQVTGLSFGQAPAEPAGEVELTTLVEGDGEPIRDNSLVTMDYVGQVYGADEPFNNSYAQEPATFAVGVGQLIPAWDDALVGVKSGSRVLLSVPPEQGYGAQGNPSIDVAGDDTIVFLIDVLGVG